MDAKETWLSEWTCLLLAHVKDGAQDGVDPFRLSTEGRGGHMRWLRASRNTATIFSQFCLFVFVNFEGVIWIWELRSVFVPMKEGKTQKHGVTLKFWHSTPQQRLFNQCLQWLFSFFPPPGPYRREGRFLVQRVLLGGFDGALCLSAPSPISMTSRIPLMFLSGSVSPASPLKL